jgi:ribonuclease-3
MLALMDSNEVLERCQAALGHRFADPQLLRSALTHTSVAGHRLGGYERLEFLGDAVLGLAVCEELYRRFPDLQEGDMTKIKSIVVSRKTCADMSRSLGLDRMIFAGKGMIGRDGPPVNLAAAVFESVTAAYYLDAGFDRVRDWILALVEPHIDAVVSDTHAKNFKSILQQYAQREFGASPQYELLDEKGPDHGKCFEVGVAIRGRRFPSAWANTKKEAEQKAALAALMHLGADQLPEIGAVLAEAVGGGATPGLVPPSRPQATAAPAAGRLPEDEEDADDEIIEGILELDGEPPPARRTARPSAGAVPAASKRPTSPAPALPVRAPAGSSKGKSAARKGIGPEAAREIVRGLMGERGGSGRGAAADAEISHVSEDAKDEYDDEDRFFEQAERLADRLRG